MAILSYVPTALALAIFALGLIAAPSATNHIARIERADPITDQKIILWRVRCSSHEDEFELPQYFPMLTIRLKGATLDALITYGGMHLGRNRRIATDLRIDRAPARSQIWTVSTDGQAAISPDADTLLEDIRAASNIVVRLHDTSHGTMTATFPVTNLTATVRREIPPKQPKIPVPYFVPIQ